MTETETHDDAAALLAECRELKLVVATAESCTGGLVAAAITDIPGSSDIFDRGFVTYSNKAKQEMLGVAARTLLQFGAVSAQTAIEMAEGALKHSRADLAASITGVAGPGGGTAQKPVGLVHFACARRGRETVHVERRFGALSRHEIRAASVKQALNMLLETVRI
ncbi:CinA family protein [Methylocystis heyeri]|uniref:Nicotinamide-nucleotide amidohydrolase family protein n=1 Tax=Methylocystis heyeri TaxID=391905 RepID=A0A6B8KBA8_9HYPH|nr:CinA family protein [Methylocystis heyeri]QGM44957.1 nicotinamide-nucleotide amidohydrolase family protein [Methylocystis heyeri]